jgi:hypothetical protein
VPGHEISRNQPGVELHAAADRGLALLAPWPLSVRVGQTVGGGQTMTSRAVVFGPGGGLLHWDGRL